MSARLRNGQSRIAHLRQQGSFKALFPRSQKAALDCVFLNTAGGITGGDRFHLSAEAEADTRLTLTSQAAERIYRAQPGETGRLSSRLTVGARARIDWLPQETIVFDHARFDRRLDAQVDPTGQLLIVEPMIFGRAAMGERVHMAQITDRWRVRRGRDLIFADTLHLTGDVDAFLQNGAVANGARAMASILWVAPAGENRVNGLNLDLGDQGAASSPRPGVVFARCLAEDGFTLRQCLIPAIRRLTGGDLPRTWML